MRSPLSSFIDFMRTRNTTWMMTFGRQSSKGEIIALSTLTNHNNNIDHNRTMSETAMTRGHHHHHHHHQKQLQLLPLTRHHYFSVPLTLMPSMRQQYQQQRQLSPTPTPGIKNDMKNSNSSSSSSSNQKNTRSRSSTDDKMPLLNEHLIAELFNKMRGRVGGGEEISADTYQVRLIVDRGRRSIHHDHGAENNVVSSNSSGSSNEISNKTTTNSNQDVDNEDDVDDDDDDNDNDAEDDEAEEIDALSSSPTKSSSSSSSSSSQSSQITTLNRAISIAHEYELDLMEVTLQVHPPVIKAVNYEKFAYEQRRKQSKAISSKKKKGGGGAISDRPVKEYKFRAGIADHDLNRKTRGMIEYLEAGHAVRVTLTARQRSLNEDSNAITTTLERVKELLGDKAVEARGMKANDRNSYGSLLFHPNTKK